MDSSISYRRRDTTSIPIMMLEGIRMSKSDHLPALALFMKLRCYTRGNVFFNYKPESLAKFLGVSPNTVRRYISVMIQMGLVRKSGDNLIWIGWKKVLDGYGYTKTKKLTYLNFRIPNDMSFVDIKGMLKALVLKINTDRQDYALDCRKMLLLEEGERLKVSYPKFKKMLKAGRLYHNEFSLTVPVLTCKSVSRLLGVSHSTASYILNRLQDKGIIRKKLFYEQGPKMSYQDFMLFIKSMSDNNCHYRYHNGCACRLLGQSIKFNGYYISC